MTLYMPLFRSCRTISQLTQLHAHLLVSDLRNDPQACTKLIESYAQMDSLQSSRLVFDTFNNPDSFMLGVLIKCHVRFRLFRDAISLYGRMLSGDFEIGGFVFPSVLRACAGSGDLKLGEKIHGRVIKCGFDSDAVTETSLLGLYGELGVLNEARKVFDNMPVRDLVSWSSIVSSYIANGEVVQGLEMFRLLVSEGGELDSVMMIAAAEACGDLGLPRLARSVHGYSVRRKMESSVALRNSLIVMYGKCGDLFSAERIFKNVIDRSLVSWTAMISCYNRSGLFQQALELFTDMLRSEVEPNAVTFMGVLGACAGLRWLRGGKSLHCHVYKKHIDLGDDCLGPALIELYSKCDELSYCEKFLRADGEGNIVSWNMLISIYANRGLYGEAITLFVQMLKQGLMPDSFGLSSTVSSCGDAGGFIKFGQQIHGHAIKRHLLDEFVRSSLIDMYTGCSFMNSAYLIFDEVQQNSVVTWNSMISGFSQNGNAFEAVSLFDQMYLHHLQMNEVTFLSAIQASSQMGHLARGKWLHHKLITHGIRKDVYVDTALVDMYSKCGDLDAAQRVFDSMPERNAVSFSVMIAGYGMHGHIDAAISLFCKMVEVGIKPNDITFMNILSACSHSGSVEKGKFYFNLMREFSIEPNSEHYACMVDILSRAGDLSGAHRMINSMPFPANANIWGALLNGCRIHQRIDMIQSIERKLLDAKTDDTGHYALLSNMYAEERNWKEFKKLRTVMESRGLKKVPGCSIIEFDRTYRLEL